MAAQADHSVSDVVERQQVLHAGEHGVAWREKSASTLRKRGVLRA